MNMRLGIVGFADAGEYNEDLVREILRREFKRHMCQHESDFEVVANGLPGGVTGIAYKVAHDMGIKSSGIAIGVDKDSIDDHCGKTLRFEKGFAGESVDAVFLFCIDHLLLVGDDAKAQEVFDGYTGVKTSYSSPPPEE